MKKMGYRILAAAASVILAVTPLSVSAESLVPPISTNELYSIVLAVNEGGNCLILDDYNNKVIITQEEFHQYADVDFDLRPGDVFFCYDAAQVYSNSYACGYCIQNRSEEPFEPIFEDTTVIRYLGTAEEFYGDQVKELTVTDTTKRLMAMTDEDGEIYYTEVGYDWGWAESGESYGIPSGGYHVGDKVLCATVDGYQNHSNPHMSAVILEKTYEFEEPDYNIFSPIVTAVSEDGKCCLLSDGTTVTQSKFREASGEAFDLQKGDVISVEGEQITYLGKAQEIYSDYIKELTVSDMDKNAEPVWRDADGIVYHADISYGDVWRRSGVPNDGLSLYNFWVGDTALCVTGVTENADYYGCGAVILEITSEVKRPEPTMWSAPIVVAVAGDYCLLDNEVAISQSTFKKYSGEDFDLKVGDVIWVQRTDGSGQCVMETYPGQYCVDIYTRMIYCGKAKDYYTDKLMELTVTDINKNGYPVWSDADGVTYSAVHSYYPSDMGGWADSVGFAPSDFSIGDKALFAVGYVNYSNTKSAIILEKTFEAEYDAGDVTGDGETNLLDVVAINKNIMIGEKLAPAGKKAADFNGDGKLDPSESLHLLKYLVKVVDTLQFD